MGAFGRVAQQVEQSAIDGPMLVGPDSERSRVQFPPLPLSFGTRFAGEETMGRYNGWKAVCRYLDAPNVKRWYKKLIHRKNRRAAKQNPERASERKDKPLDPWAID